MNQVISKDGTAIAFDRSGKGPAVILVTGALTTGADWALLAACLAPHVLVPTLVMSGGASYPFMYETARALSQAIPHAQLRTLEGQTHDVAPEVLAPVLVEFFKG